jgi:hypothetical protein
MFTRMVALRSDDEEKAALRTLAELEATMRDALEPVFERVGISVPSCEDAARRGRETGEVLAAGSWLSFLEAFEAGTNRALQGYARLHACADDLDEPAIIALSLHERALLTFAKRALNARDDSLHPVRSAIVTITALGSQPH